MRKTARCSLKRIASVVVCGLLPPENNDHIVPSIVRKQQGEKERHLQREPETIPVMVHCACDKHGEATSLSSFWLPRTDNVLVKY